MASPESINDGYFGSMVRVVREITFSVSRYARDEDGQKIPINSKEGDPNDPHPERRWKLAYEPVKIRAKMDLSNMNLQKVFMMFVDKSLKILAADKVRHLDDRKTILATFEGPIDVNEWLGTPRAASKAKSEQAIAGQSDEAFVESIRRMCAIREMDERQTESVIKQMTG